MAPITPRQLEVLTQIEAFHSSRCYSATIGELAEALKLSRPTVFEHIAALREKNMVAPSNGKARCLQLTARGKRVIATVRRLEAEAECPDETPAAGNGERRLLAGRVSAGYGIEAIEEPQPFLMGSVFGCEEGQFVLQVVGSSMKDAGILDGD